MPLRRRMAVATAVAVGIAVVLAAAVAYAAVRGELRRQVDDQLLEQAGLVRNAEARLRPEIGRRLRHLGMPPGRGFGIPALPIERGGSAAYVQFVPGRGGAALTLTGPELPVDDRVRAVADGEGGEFLADAHVDGDHVRVLTAPLRRGGALRLARSLQSTDAVLARLRWVLVALVVGGIALAALLGRLAARHLVAPVRRVSEAARHIAQTEDLGRRIAVSSHDEVGELAERFNAMLDTLEGSIAAQRQLVADASHELRTPVTSLRTNIEVLAESDLEPAERARVIADVEAQAEELSLLVADLIELARGDQGSPAREDVRLDELAAEAIERARRHAPAVEFAAQLEPAVVDGVPDRLARAVNNLLDNAARHGTRVLVRTGPEGISVLDNGPGIDPADLPHIFDRFYRGAADRGRSGTGLGLAIVRQVAEQHGGTVAASNADGGGAEFALWMPANTRL
ncbi:MAG TPA: HAMP domain-containing sensor histidine kinase [Solirubrobacteraceae bacterium]|jgi:two-component system sensor histidine kinase MprB|nr:HAMP domain-containing sensor histidine kinase [Solirubrobacteraceae bacterium]